MGSSGRITGTSFYKNFVHVVWVDTIQSFVNLRAKKSYSFYFHCSRLIFT